MGPSVLVNDQVETGRRFLETMDANGFPVQTAYWYLEPDWVYWRFAIHSPLLDKLDSLAVRRMIDAQLRGCGAAADVADLGVILVRSRNPRLLQLRAFHGTDPAPYIGGNELSRVYLYRAERLVPETGTVDVTFAIRDKVAKRWVASPGSLTYADGRLTALVSEPGAARTRQRKHGLSARFFTLDGMFTTKGQTIGHLRRWEYSDGRLEVFREEVHPVPVAVATPTSP